MGAQVRRNSTSLFPATLREGARGGASLREAASPGVPQRCNGRGGSVSRRDLNPKTRKRAQLTWARKSKGTHKPIPSYSSGGGTGAGASLEKPPPPAFPSAAMVAAALSAAVTSTPKQENAPNLHGHASPKERTSLFPATLREGARGGASLEKPLPRRSPSPRRLFEREREGERFSSEKHSPSLDLLVILLTERRP